MKRFFFLPLVLALVVLAQLSAQRVRQAAPLRVATSITPLADLIRNVGADRVEVLALVPLGDEPEDYDPTPADAVALSRAQIFFANGLGLEAYLEDLIDAVRNPQLEVVRLSDGLPALQSFGQGAEAGGNPHLWLNPRHAAAYISVIAATLSRLDPDGAADYEANATRYVEHLIQLDSSVEQQVQTIPSDQRVLVTVHDALPYFAQRYGFTYLAVISAQPGADPSAQEYAALVKAVKDNRVKAVFGEAGFSDRFIQQLADDTGARYVADLYTDTLSDGPPADTYLNMMRHNADVIVEALR
jgi:manganese/iron transport system substrate-binding protein